MDMELKITLMTVQNTSVTGLKGRNMELEYLFKSMVLTSKACMLKIICWEMVLHCLRMAHIIWGKCRRLRLLMGTECFVSFLRKK